MEQLSARQSETIKRRVDARLEFVVLYAIGDAIGPATHEVKIGVSTREAYREQVRQMGKFRAAPLVARLEAIISGRGKAEMIKTDLLAALGGKGFAYKSFRHATDGELSATVGRLCETYQVRIYSADEADNLERETFDAIAAEVAGA